MEALADFREQGKIRYGGVSNFSPRQMRESMDTFPVVCNQVGYHLFDFRPEAEVFPFCRENGLGVMVYGPMAHGLLTGTMTPDTTFEDNDWRRTLEAFGQPLFEGEHFLGNLKKVDALKEIAGQHGRTVAQLALAWVLSNPAVSVALAGTRRTVEIEENVLAADWDLTPDLRDEITADRHRPGPGVSLPAAALRPLGVKDRNPCRPAGCAERRTYPAVQGAVHLHSFAHGLAPPVPPRPQPSHPPGEYEEPCY